MEHILEAQKIDSLFDLRPTSDHRPYFTNFFRFSQLREVWSNLGKRWLPFGGAGVLVVLFVSGVVVILATLTLLRPLRSWGERRCSGREKILLGGSACTGIGFMFLEIALFVRLALFVGIPLYTFSLLLIILLVGSGWGSWYVGKPFWKNRLKLGALLHRTLLGGYLFFLTSLGNYFLSLPIIVVLPVVAIAFLSGFPFPFLAERVRLFCPSLFPFIFAYNGFFSVISSLLAHLIVVFWGVEWAFLLAFFSYGIFWWLLLRFSPNPYVSLG